MIWETQTYCVDWHKRNKNMMRLGLMILKQSAAARLWTFKGKAGEVLPRLWVLGIPSDTWNGGIKERGVVLFLQQRLLIDTHQWTGLTPHCSRLSSGSYQWKSWVKSYFLSISDILPHMWEFHSKILLSLSCLWYLVQIWIPMMKKIKVYFHEALRP